MGRPRKNTEEGSEKPYEVTMYTKDGKLKPALTAEIAEILENDGWEQA
jgi:hypothetical protein